MGLLDFFKRKRNSYNNVTDEHAVIIHFAYKKNSLEELHPFEDELEKAILENNVGEYDGHEIAVDYSDGFLYMYGPNAEILFETIQPILKNCDFMENAEITLRFGPPEDGVKEIKKKLD